MDDRPAVMVYRDKLLPPSEGFIPRHYTHLSRHRVIYAGAQAVPAGLAMLGDVPAVTVRDGAAAEAEGGAGRRGDLVYRLTGGSGILDAFIEVERPRLIHAHFGKSGTRILPTAIAHDLPLVVSFHGGDATKHAHFKPFWRTGEVFALRREALIRRTSLFIAVSGYVRDVLIRHGFPEDRIVVHHIGIDTDRYQRDPRIYREMSVLFVGRFVEKKGVDVLIRAMAKVQDRDRYLDLVLIGSGPEELRLRRLARETGVRCRFLGWQPPDAVREWMQRAEMLAVPSVVAPNGDCEGLPSVIFEANALALPVVGSRHSGIPEGVEDGVTGLLSDEHDVEGLARNILALHGDPLRRMAMGEKAREKAIGEQDARLRAEALETLFDRAVETHAGLSPKGRSGADGAGRTPARRKILVIRFSALGDFIISTGPFQAIRAHHAQDEITLLTTPPYAEMGRQSGYFDRVVVTERPRASDLAGWWRLISRLRSERFDRAYDFHQNDRTAAMFQALRLGRRIEWSGSAWGASHRVDNRSARRRAMHSYDKQVDQMAVAGLSAVPRPDISWMNGDIRDIALPARFALLVPGAAPTRPQKRWPADRFAALALWLVEQGLPPVIVGGPPERDAARIITATCPEAMDLVERTTIADIAALARRATVAVGNDTGPMHVAAAAGCQCVVLYSSDSDPALTRPMGPDPDAVTVVQRNRLVDLSADDVIAAAAAMITPPPA